MYLWPTFIRNQISSLGHKESFHQNEVIIALNILFGQTYTQTKNWRENWLEPVQSILNGRGLLRSLAGTENS